MICEYMILKTELKICGLKKEDIEKEDPYKEVLRKYDAENNRRKMNLR